MDSTKLLLTCITSVAVSIVAAYAADRISPFEQKTPPLGNEIHVSQQGGGSGVNHIICSDS